MYKITRKKKDQGEKGVHQGGHDRSRVREVLVIQLLVLA